MGIKENDSQVALDGMVEQTLNLVDSSAETLREAVALGVYNQFDEEILRRYPPTGYGVRAATVDVVRFNRTVKPEAALGWLERNNFLTLTLAELLAIGNQCPEAQRLGPLVGLGAPLDKDLYYPVLEGYAVWRALKLWLYVLVCGGEQHKGGFTINCRFPVKRRLSLVP